MIKINGKPHIYLVKNQWLLHDPVEDCTWYSHTFKNLINDYRQYIARRIVYHMTLFNLSINIFSLELDMRTLPSLTNSQCIELSSETIYAYQDIRKWFPKE